MNKKCSVCGKTNEEVSFSPKEFYYCKPCKSQRSKEYYSTYKDRAYFERLKYKFGVDREWFEKQWKLQNGKCVCGFEFSMFTGDQTKSPHVDHDHTTKKVRGLLCSRCNTVIGFLELDSKPVEDSFLLFSNLMKYLKEAK